MYQVQEIMFERRWLDLVDIGGGQRHGASDKKGSTGCESNSLLLTLPHWAETSLSPGGKQRLER